MVSYACELHHGCSTQTAWTNISSNFYMKKCYPNIDNATDSNLQYHQSTCGQVDRVGVLGGVPG